MQRCFSSLGACSLTRQLRRAGVSRDSGVDSSLVTLLIAFSPGTT